MSFITKVNLLSIGLLCLASCSLLTTPSYDLYLVRHGEKASGPNPALTQCGQLRAGYLANQLKDKNILSVYSTDYQRTQLTARPLAEELGLPIESYNPRELTEFATFLKQRRETALIVGHSNTTPKLATILSNQSFDKLPESEFDQLFMVRINGEKVTVEQKNQEFHCSKSQH